MRSNGFWMQSSHRFSLDPVLDVAAELTSEAADGALPPPLAPEVVVVGLAKLEIAPRGPVSNHGVGVIWIRCSTRCHNKIILLAQCSFGLNMETA